MKCQTKGCKNEATSFYLGKRYCREHWDDHKKKKSGRKSKSKDITKLKETLKDE